MQIQSTTAPLLIQFPSLLMRMATRKPQFPFTFRYGLGLNDALQWDDVKPLSDYFEEIAPSTLDLPRDVMVRHHRTEAFPLYPEGATISRDSAEAIDFFNISTLTGYENYVSLLDGTFPEAAPEDELAEMSVLMSAVIAEELGVSVGDRFFLYMRDRSPDDLVLTTTIPAVVTGLWYAADPEDAFWVLPPEVYTEHLLIPEASFEQRVSPFLPDEVYGMMWHLIMDGADVNYSKVPQLLTNINDMVQESSTLLPNIRLVTSPREQLGDYERNATILNVSLLALGVPIVGLILGFIALTSNLSLDQRRNEIAVLRSRGALRIQLALAAALEGAILGVIAILIALPASMWIAQLIGQTERFLDFSAPFDVRLVVTPLTIMIGVGVILISLMAIVIPTIGASGHTIISYKQERTRMQRLPWWQRWWLDVLLLIPAGYGAYLLQEQGNIAVLDREINRNPFENPLLFLVPALGVLALSLFSLRLMPLLMRLIAWVANFTEGTAFVLATRYLSRTPGYYNTPLLLLVLTLSLSILTSSLAQTLDEHLKDQSYYQVGADVSFSDFGEDQLPDQQPTEGDPEWIFRPVSDYVEYDGVDMASRVGIYAASSSVGGRSQSSQFVGVDRYDFQDVAYWRDDFAPDDLATLMNELAFNPDGVLVPFELMDDFNLQVGDALRITIHAFGVSTPVDFRIVGGFHYFPPWIPEEGPLYVGNLDYLFQSAGAPFPYRVWLATDGADITEAESTWKRPSDLIDQTQHSPQRQGVFGLLSVGFLAAAILSVLGFLLYILFSFRRRFIEIGVLRAVGLSSSQMVWLLTWELIFLTVMGGIIGTLLGSWASAWFIPHLQVDTGPMSNVPPVLVELAWSAITPIYLLFTLLFVVALVTLGLILRRMRIFQAIKLGETV